MAEREREKLNKLWTHEKMYAATSFTATIFMVEEVVDSEEVNEERKNINLSGSKGWSEQRKGRQRFIAQGVV